jgi:hypothetical protein
MPREELEHMLPALEYFQTGLLQFRIECEIVYPSRYMLGFARRGGNLSKSSVYTGLQKTEAETFCLASGIRTRRPWFRMI